MHPEIVIRPAALADDPYEIASLIMLTDPFIYPVGFGMKGVPALAEMIHEDGNIFNYKNILTAFSARQLIGQSVVLACNSFTPIDADCYQRSFPTLPDAFKNMVNHYLNHLQDYVLCPDDIYIPCVSVSQNARGQGVGSALINYLVKKNSDKNLRLHVLADNHAAISLYKKFGFQITGDAIPGYAYKEKAPLCYEMIRLSGFGDGLRQVSAANE